MNAKTGRDRAFKREAADRKFRDALYADTPKPKLTRQLDRAHGRTVAKFERSQAKVAARRIRRQSRHTNRTTSNRGEP